MEEKVPLKNLEEQMLDKGVKQEEIDQIQAEIRQEVEDAVEFAVNSPFPEVEEAKEDIYAPQ